MFGKRYLCCSASAKTKSTLFIAMLALQQTRKKKTNNSLDVSPLPRLQCPPDTLHFCRGWNQPYRNVLCFCETVCGGIITPGKQWQGYTRTNVMILRVVWSSYGWRVDGITCESRGGDERSGGRRWGTDFRRRGARQTITGSNCHICVRVRLSR